MARCGALGNPRSPRPNPARQVKDSEARQRVSLHCPEWLEIEGPEGTLSRRFQAAPSPSPCGLQPQLLT